MNKSCYVLLILLYPVIGSSDTKVKDRSVFLNGVEISNAKHQSLQNVNVKIDGNGHLYIEAPHYEVSEESTYIPLSSWQKKNPEKHHNKGPLPDSRKAIQNAQGLPPVAKRANPVSPVGQLDSKPMIETAEKETNANNIQVPASTEPNPQAMPNPQTTRTDSDGSKQETTRQ